MSDGLYPPLNAPPAGAAVPGVQPGTTGQFFGFIVIVYGPAGTPSGVFVYQPGTTPALGNPPIVGLTASTTDLFGNPVPGGGVPELFVQAPGGTGQYVLLTSSTPSTGPAVVFATREAIEDPSNGSAGVFESISNQGAANESLVLEVSGPEIVTPNNQFAEVVFSSSLDDGSQTAFGQLVYGDDNTGQQYVVSQWGNGGLFIPACNRLDAQAPGATVPTPETWHNLSLPSGLTGTLRIKMAAQTNFAILDVNVNFAFTSAAQTFNCGALPSSGYYPVNTQRLYPGAVNGTPSGITASFPRLFIPSRTAGGAIQVIVPSGSGASAEFCGTFLIPLD